MSRQMKPASAGRTLRTLRQAALVGALGLLVGVLGLFTGAYVMSPDVPPTQRLIGLSLLSAIVVVALLSKLFLLLSSRSRHRGSRRSVGRFATATAAPTMTLRTGKTRRTPKAVVALAAAGAAPIEIARKTGLPVDAVAMLLQLGRTPVAA